MLEVVAEGGKVVLVDRFGSIHRGEFFGRPGTSDRIEWMAIRIYAIPDCKVLEDTYMRDELAIMRQLGLAPSASSLRRSRMRSHLPREPTFSIRAKFFDFVAEEFSCRIPKP